MIRHKIYARHYAVDINDRLDIPLIKKCVRVSLDSEEVETPCEVSVLITNDLVIKEINREFRGIETPTDVLSFPMQQFSEAGWNNRICDEFEDIDPETGLVPLGEIVLSAERVAAQASGFGHRPERETAYLTVHSVLHLLGYDHLDEAAGKRNMREREEQILKEIGF